MREDQQEHQQQMIEILEKVGDQVKRVENMCSGSVPALEGEYDTPPVSQMRVNTSSKLSAPQICLYFWDKNWSLLRKGQLTNGSSRWRSFSNYHRGSSQVSCDRISLRSSP